MSRLRRGPLRRAVAAVITTAGVMGACNGRPGPTSSSPIGVADTVARTQVGTGDIFSLSYDGFEDLKRRVGEKIFADQGQLATGNLSAFEDDERRLFSFLTQHNAGFEPGFTPIRLKQEDGSDNFVFIYHNNAGYAVFSGGSLRDDGYIDLDSASRVAASTPETYNMAMMSARFFNRQLPEPSGIAR